MNLTVKLTPHNCRTTFDNLITLSNTVLAGFAKDTDDLAFNRWFFCVTAKVGCLPPDAWIATISPAGNSYRNEQVNKLQASFYLSCAMATTHEELMQFAKAAETAIKNCAVRLAGSKGIAQAKSGCYVYKPQGAQNLKP